MQPTGIVADHTPDRAMAVRRRIGSESELVFRCGAIKIIVNQSWLHARQFSRRVQLDQMVHVLRKIDNHRSITALAGKTRSAASTCDWNAVFAAKSYYFLDVFIVTRENYSNRRLPIVELSVEYSARLPASNRTSPRIALRSSRCRSLAAFTSVLESEEFLLA